MIDPQAQAEAIKLARLLDTEAGELEFLHALPAADTRAFREAVSDSLFNEHRSGFARLAKLSSLLPTGLTASLAQKALGPMLSARVAGELAPERAVALAKKLPPAFMAKLGLDLEPRRAEPVIAAMPESVVVPVALELLAAREYVTMAQFVDALADTMLSAAIAAIDSDEALLRIGFFVENPERLDQLIGLLPSDRLAGTARATVAARLWPEALALIERVAPATQLELARVFAQQDDNALEQLVETAEAQALWPDVVALYARLPETDQAELGRRARVSPAHYDKLKAAADKLGRGDALATMDSAYRDEMGHENR